MKKSLSKNVMLDNLTPMVMILLATVCNIMTIAVFALSGCSGALVQKTAKDPKISAHLMYTVSGLMKTKLIFKILILFMHMKFLFLMKTARPSF